MQPSVLVIGAGMTGLTAARLLESAGVDVAIVDKGRAVGGRMATRRVGDAAFDHGAQHISARTEAFRRDIRNLEKAGTARVWIRTESVTSPERGVENRYVGVGGMRRIPEALADGLSVSTGIRVDRLSLESDAVTAFAGSDAVATADAALLTAPLPQTLDLLRTSGTRDTTLLNRLAAVQYDATLAVMATLDAPPNLDDGHLALTTGPVAWMADNGHKGVSRVPALTLHSSAGLAARHLKTDPDEWAKTLLRAARPHHSGEVIEIVTHRWRYSQPQTTLDEGAVLVDGRAPIVLAGEVFCGARVEGAYLSGRAAAGMLHGLFS